MSQLWSHERFIDGYSKTNKTVGTVTLSVSYQLNRYEQQMNDLPPELVERELAYRLAVEIIKSGQAIHYRHFDQETFADTIVASVTVCPAEIKFRQVENQSFVVNGEHFTEQDIINAIKHTYPDRII